MAPWFIILVSIAIAAILKVLTNLNKKPTQKKLPPGPVTFPIISNLKWLLKSYSEIETTLKNLHARLGPMVTLYIGSTPTIFIADRSLAHKALIQNGAIFADRPKPLVTNNVITANQHNISSAFYGPTWRLFRRNITSEILNSSRVRSHKHTRKWVLQILLDSLISDSKNCEVPVRVMVHFHHAIFCLLVLMCFGDKIDQKQIKEVERVHRARMLAFANYNIILNFLPSLTKILFRKKWEQLIQLCTDCHNVMVPFIRAREKAKEERLNKSKDEYVLSYVDTLLDLQLPEENRKLDDKEIVSLCSEFLTGGTDTTSTALQWIMANLVKYPDVQERLLMDMKGVVEEGAGEVKEEDLQKMPYLKAVVLEGLRRHPPGHFLLPHSVTEDFVLDDYLIPKDGTVNFMVAGMGLDPKVWKDPMAFKPERFLNGDFDITGSREIKMMPFGVGRRICPGLSLGMLLLEYFVANLVWCFEWKAVDGDDVDLSEKQEFTMLMKNPLQAHISPRIK